MSFVSAYVERRTKKNKFFNQIDSVIDWQPIEKEINKAYKKGSDVVGRKAYPGIMLFKMLLVGIWYGLSDERTEEMVCENLSASKFCGLEVEDDVPDHSVLSRFRKELTEKRAFDRIFNKVNQQLKEKKVLVKGCVKVDASITETPLIPSSKPTFVMAEDREEDDRNQDDIDAEQKQQEWIKENDTGADYEARWLKKGNKSKYGYKKHYGVDVEGLVVGVHTTTANEHDSNGLEPLIKKVDPDFLKQGVYADKGYKVPKNDELLKSKGIKNRIQRKAYRNRPLTKWEKLFNKLISKSRYVVERTFGGMKRWFGAGVARYKGLALTHTQHVLEAIAYNLYRTPGIIMSRPVGI
jgi:transposase, IS5 family